jgi:hypothetical protein
MFELKDKVPASDKPTLYAGLAADLKALIAGERDLIANAANFTSLVYHTLPDVNWVGIYLLKDGELVLGPFQGKRPASGSRWAEASAAPPRRAARPCSCRTSTPSPATSPATASRAPSWSSR